MFSQHINRLRPDSGPGSGYKAKDVVSFRKRLYKVYDER